ncbi:MAG: NAD-dependent DNA ligase LigA [Clostridiales bacterium]|nr:NAD-dependent DNA ligase LigA [Clostridiales bacterium]
MKPMNTPKQEIENLRKQLAYHSQKYYEDDAPEISDYEYDALFRKLQDLEREHPEYADDHSPTVRVGGRALEKFEKIQHRVPLKSLQDVFSFEELEDFIHGLSEQPLSFSVECKIDGLSVALTYEHGKLISGGTRGDGIIGEDVTQNIKTIKNIPLYIDEPGRLVVRGEVYMPKSSFQALNDEREKNEEPLFANPRNAAAGSLRQLDSKITAKRNLDIFIFNIQESEHSFQNHDESLAYLEKIGFPVVPYRKTLSSFNEIKEQIELIDQIRKTLAFDIDGVVIKVNSLQKREDIGENTNTPKWAVAYKFPPEQKETVLRDICINVGRTGVLTPNAVFDPIQLAGTTVSRATLHNKDFIAQKDIRIGDTVCIQKAGDIIPAVVSVNTSKRAHNTIPFQMPSVCPSCGQPVFEDVEEAAVRCTNAACPAQLIRNVEHFVSRDAMDIDGLGPAVAKLLKENELVKDASDLYYLQAEDIEKLERMGQKSADNLIAAIEKSKNAGLARLLYALGIRQVGEKAATVLAAHFKDIEAFFIVTVEELTAIKDVGEITARYIVDYFSLPSTRMLIDRLKACGVVCHVQEEEKQSSVFEGMTFVITGTLPHMTREEAEKIIVQNGGKATSSVSKKTSYVLAGEKAGSKLDKAQNLGIPILDEAAFLNMVE